MGKFMVIGYGSIGQRHASILREMGHEVVTVDPHNPEADLKSVGDTRRPCDGVLICTPANIREKVAQGLVADRTNPRENRSRSDSATTGSPLCASS